MTEKPTPPRKGTRADLKLRLNRAEQTIQFLANSTLTRRAAYAASLGKQFDGDRDLYAVFGYKISPDFQDFLLAYEREGLAARVADAKPNATWSKHPILYVGGEAPSEENPGELQKKFDEFANEYDLYAKLKELDRACAISRFGLMFLGLPGDPREPVENVREGDLAFITVHDEGDGEIDEGSIIQDTENPRFGLPEYYYIIVSETNQEKKRVHHSRVIHYKRGKQRTGYGRVYGVPDLKNIFNRFYDLEKVVGGGSEAFWLLVRKGLALMARDGMNLPSEGTDAYEVLEDEVEEYEHQLSRIMKLVGLDIQELGSDPVSSRDQFDVLIEYIAGSEEIPQRLLLGSERGELASSQDQANWFGNIEERRNNEAEPYILRPVLDKLDELGLFDLPDEYKVFWPPLFTLTEPEEVEVASTVAQTIYTITGGMPELAIPLEEFMKLLPGKWSYAMDKEQIKKIEEAKRKPDEANQKEDEKTKVDISDLLSKLPQGEETKQNARAIMSRLIEGVSGSIKGDLVENFGTLDAYQNPMVWHNANGTGEYATMIAFMIPEVIRQELKAKYPWIQDDVLDEMHMTLVYLGDIRTLSRARIFEAVAEFASTVQPIKTTMQGLARFVSEMEKDPIVATYDSPQNEIVMLREQLAAILRTMGIPYHDNHGFIPHTTFAYIPKNESMPDDSFERVEINFNMVSVVIGQEQYDFDLGRYPDNLPEIMPPPPPQKVQHPIEDSGLDPYNERGNFDPANEETH